jgi:hypothetical protein
MSEISIRPSETHSDAVLNLVISTFEEYHMCGLYISRNVFLVTRTGTEPSMFVGLIDKRDGDATFTIFHFPNVSFGTNGQTMTLPMT